VLEHECRHLLIADPHPKTEVLVPGDQWSFLLLAALDCAAPNASSIE